jgi:hypothetical protein
MCKSLYTIVAQTRIIRGKIRFFKSNNLIQTKMSFVKHGAGDFSNVTFLGTTFVSNDLHKNI